MVIQQSHLDVRMNFETRVWKDEQGNTGELPVFTTKGAACADIVCPVDFDVPPRSAAKIPTYISFKYPDGKHVIRMYPRSSLLIKRGLMQPVTNCDADFEAPVSVPVFNMTDETVHVKKGERLAQIEYVECGDRPESWTQMDEPRDQAGFGGSGL